MKNDYLALAKGTIQVPPRVVSAVQRRKLALPSEAEEILEEFGVFIRSSAHSFKTFIENGEFDILCETDWTRGAEIDCYGGRYIPYVVSTDIADGSFSHELCALSDFSIESLQHFVEDNGWLFLPYFDSQKRFIDFRNRVPVDSEDSLPAYKDLYPCLIDEDTRREIIDSCGKDEGERTINFCNAVKSILLSVSSSSGKWAGDEDNNRMVSMGEMTVALVLSEFARRELLANRDICLGGVVSCCEVYLTATALQRAMRVVEEYEVAGKDLNKLREGIKFSDNSEKGAARRRVVNDILEDDDISDLRKGFMIHNLWEDDLTSAIDFLSRCAFSSPGTCGVGLRRVSPDPDALCGERLHTSMRFVDCGEGKQFDMEWFDRKQYLRRVHPLYFESIYAEGSYSAAVAAQFFDVLNSDLEWRVCDECGRYFKLKYVKGKKKVRNRQSLYCSEKCAQAAKNSRNNKTKSVAKTAAERLKRGLPGYGTYEEALASIEKDMSEFYEGNRLGKLPEARSLWRKLLNKALAESEKSKKTPPAL